VALAWVVGTAADAWWTRGDRARSRASVGRRLTRYRPEIDGLRALAIIPVILFHAGFETFKGGFVGVDVFFVISGYLITGLILDEIKQGSFSIVRFYERRIRRILPALFFVCLVCIPFAWLWMLPSEFRDFSKSLAAVSLFVSNFYFWNKSGYFEAATELKPLLHTWSLAVEEQFYILWPALILFAPRRLLLKLVISAIVIGPLFRVAAHFLDFNWIARMTVLPASLDALGLGALLAYSSHHAGERPILIKRLKQGIYWLGVPGLIALLGLQKLEDYNLVGDVTVNSWFIEPVLWALMFVWVINRASLGFSGVGAKILEFKPLAYTGKISYGIYVYHPFVYALLPILFYRTGVNFFLLPRLLQFGLLVGTTVGMAALSWYFLESPINSLKNHFTYAEQNARSGIQRLKAV